LLVPLQAIVEYDTEYLQRRRWIDHDVLYLDVSWTSVVFVEL